MAGQVSDNSEPWLLGNVEIPRFLFCWEVRDHTKKLPDEVLLMIFSKLTKRQLLQCSMVCRRWWRISFDERLGLWSRVRIRGENDLTLPILATVIQRGVRDLSLGTEHFIRDPPSWENIFPHGYTSKLQILDLSRLTISEKGLAFILQYTGQLTRLNLGYCSLNEECCEAIARNVQLKSLNLSHSSMSSEGLRIIFLGCRSLEVLDIGATSLTTETLDSVVPLLSPVLLILRINYMECLNDKHLLQIGQTCPNLAELDLGGNYHLTTVSSMDAISGLRNLRFVHYSIPRDPFLS